MGDLCLRFFPLWEDPAHELVLWYFSQSRIFHVTDATLNSGVISSHIIPVSDSVARTVREGGFLTYWHVQLFALISCIKLANHSQNKVQRGQWVLVEPACVHLLFEGLGPQTSLPLTEEHRRSDDGGDCDSQCFEGNFAYVISEPEWLNNTLSKGQSSWQIHSARIDCVQGAQLQTKTPDCVLWK